MSGHAACRIADVSDDIGLRRATVSRELLAWSNVFSTPPPRVRSVAFGLEIGVVLAGRRTIESAGRIERFSAGDVFFVPPGRQYVAEWEPESGGGREVGFVLTCTADVSTGRRLRCVGGAS